MHGVQRFSTLVGRGKRGAVFTVLRYGDGTEKHLPVTTPAIDLIAATEIDYREYRREIQRLQDEHLLFEDRRDIPVVDFEDFVAEVCCCRPCFRKLIR